MSSVIIHPIPLNALCMHERGESLTRIWIPWLNIIYPVWIVDQSTALGAREIHRGPISSVHSIPNQPKPILVTTGKVDCTVKLHKVYCHGLRLAFHCFDLAWILCQGLRLASHFIGFLMTSRATASAAQFYVAGSTIRDCHIVCARKDWTNKFGLDPMQ